MSLALISFLTMFLIISYISTTKKHLHTFERSFLFLFLIIIYTSYSSVVAVNLGFWDLSEKVEHQIAFRLYVVLYVPVVKLWLLDLWHIRGNNLYKRVLQLVICLTILFIGDAILRINEVYAFTSWSEWASVMAWILIVFTMLLFLRLYRALLRKERILT